MMFAVAITLLLAASGNAALTSKLDSAHTCGDATNGGCATCDEDTTFLTIDPNPAGAYCGSQLYDPSKLRCCGGTLRAQAALSDYSTADIKSKTRGKNSAFCYGDKHVSDAQMVCGTKIVSRGEWSKDSFAVDANNEGKMTKINGCCNGELFVAAEWTYTKDKPDEMTKKNVCCGGKVQAIALGTGTANKGKAIQQCCGDKVIDVNKADGTGDTLNVCCAYRDQSVSHAWKKDNTCCGTTYVSTDSGKTVGNGDCAAGAKDCKSCKCTGAAVAYTDSKGLTTGFCCGKNKRKASTWVKWTDAFSSAASTKRTDVDAKNNAKVWTIKGLCGCDNTLDTSFATGNQVTFTQQAEGDEAAIFATTAYCAAAASDDAAGVPCDAAQKLDAGAGLGCCAGKPYLACNADCKGDKSALVIAKEIRTNSYTAQADIDAIDVGGRLVEGAFGGFASGNFKRTFDKTTSTVWYNAEATKTRNWFCGASSAQAVVASVAALMAAMLAL